MAVRDPAPTRDEGQSVYSRSFLELCTLRYVRHRRPFVAIEHARTTRRVTQHSGTRSTFHEERSTLGPNTILWVTYEHPLLPAARCGVARNRIALSPA